MTAIEGNSRLIVFPRIVLFLFIVLNIIAMFCYSGGTFLDKFNPGYSFTHNFLSDLGRTMSFSGEINFISSQLFNMSLILSGGVFTLFYFQVLKVFIITNQRILALIGSVFGVLGGLSLICVGLTPVNLYLELHIICAAWLFRFFFMASLCYSWVIFRHSKLENKYALGYVIFTISILLYILISELGPNPKINQFALALQVVSQKVILIIFMFAIYIQTLGLKKLQ